MPQIFKASLVFFFLSITLQAEILNEAIELPHVYGGLTDYETLATSASGRYAIYSTPRWGTYYSLGYEVGYLHDTSVFFLVDLTDDSVIEVPTPEKREFDSLAPDWYAFSEDETKILVPVYQTIWEYEVKEDSTWQIASIDYENTTPWENTTEGGPELHSIVAPDNLRSSYTILHLDEESGVLVLFRRSNKEARVFYYDLATKEIQEGGIAVPLNSLPIVWKWLPDEQRLVQYYRRETKSARSFYSTGQHAIDFSGQSFTEVTLTEIERETYEDVWNNHEPGPTVVEKTSGDFSLKVSYETAEEPGKAVVEYWPTNAPDDVQKIEPLLDSFSDVYAGLDGTFWFYINNKPHQLDASTGVIRQLGVEWSPHRRMFTFAADRSGWLWHQGQTLCFINGNIDSPSVTLSAKDLLVSPSFISHENGDVYFVANDPGGKDFLYRTTTDSGIHAPIGGTEPIGTGWRESPWLGSFYGDHLGWLWHYGMGWIWVWPGSEPWKFYFYSLEDGWRYTQDEWFGTGKWYYVYTTGEWKHLLLPES